MRGSINIPKFHDVVVVGGGIVGVATGRQLKKEYPDMRVALLEKEVSLGLHQTGRNSGVIHAGVYYKPGSVMARLCVKGSAMTYEYVREQGIPYRECGKVIVARRREELERLYELFDRAVANEVRGVKLVGREELREIEPSCSGLRAIHSPHTGIVNFRSMTERIAEELGEMGGEVQLGREVLGVDSGGVRTREGRVQAGHVIVCGGIQADRLAGMRDTRVVAVRGEYLKLSEEKARRIRGNIYSVPDPKLPFLGVHFTPRLDGSVWVGPNALLALSREGETRSLNVRDLRDTFSHLGLYRLCAKHWRFVVGTLMSVFLPVDLSVLKSYIPDLAASDLETMTRASGVRALMVGRDGNIVEDFHFEWRGHNVLHVLNTPSPAATSSLAIAELIVDTARNKFDW